MSAATSNLARIEDGPVATVYSGHHGGVPVALKVFPKRFDKRTMSAFTKEQAKLAAVRRITSILMVDGVEELPSGEPALRMELCTQSLAGLVEKVGPLAAQDVIVLGRAVALALAAGHSAGVVHGGIAPNNVLFRNTGEPVVGDFGVTLRQAFARDPLHAIEYLPPETLRTGTLNESTDLYGLGAVLHFALSARSPHPGRLGEQPGERVLRILGEPVPAINRPDVPLGLSTLVARLLASTPEKRPTEAAVVADQLTSMLPNQPRPKTQEHWDDFDTPGPPPSRAPTPPSRPAVPQEAEDFDDFAPQYQHRPPVRSRPVPPGHEVWMRPRRNVGQPAPPLSQGTGTPPTQELNLPRAPHAALRHPTPPASPRPPGSTPAISTTAATPPPPPTAATEPTAPAPPPPAPALPAPSAPAPPATAAQTASAPATMVQAAAMQAAITPATAAPAPPATAVPVAIAPAPAAQPTTAAAATAPPTRPTTAAPAAPPTAAQVAIAPATALPAPAAQPTTAVAAMAPPTGPAAAAPAAPPTAAQVGITPLTMGQAAAMQAVTTPTAVALPATVLPATAPAPMALPPAPMPAQFISAEPAEPPLALLAPATGQFASATEQPAPTTEPPASTAGLAGPLVPPIEPLASVAEPLASDVEAPAPIVASSASAVESSASAGGLCVLTAEPLGAAIEAPVSAAPPPVFADEPLASVAEPLVSVAEPLASAGEPVASVDESLVPVGESLAPMIEVSGPGDEATESAVSVGEPLVPGGEPVASAVESPVLAVESADSVSGAPVSGAADLASAAGSVSATRVPDLADEPRPVQAGLAEQSLAGAPAGGVIGQVGVAPGLLPLAALTPAPDDGVFRADLVPTEVFPAASTVEFPASRRVDGPSRQQEFGFGDDDFADFGGSGRTNARVLAGPLAPPGQAPKRLIRYDILAGAALLLALLALVPLLLLRGDPDELSSTTQLPQTAGDVKIELAEPTDLTNKVELNWTAPRDLDFYVVIAGEGLENQFVLAERNHSMTVDVEPGLKYCFLIQATDGDDVYESESRPLRGATCGQ